MGLWGFFKRWSKAEDERALERADEETRMSPHDRDVFEEDYEARKDDTHIAGGFAGSEALGAADDE